MGQKVLATFTAVLCLVASMTHITSSDVRTEELLQVEARASYIVQGSSAESVAAIIRTVGGEITHELGIIRSVGATLTSADAASLRAHTGVHRIFGNESVEVTAGKKPKDGGGTGGNGVQDTNYPTTVLADSLHTSGIDGSGVGIAILDTGLWSHDGIRYNSAGNARFSAVYNAMTDQVAVNPMNGDDLVIVQRLHLG